MCFESERREGKSEDIRVFGVAGISCVILWRRVLDLRNMT